MDVAKALFNEKGLTWTTADLIAAATAIVDLSLRIDEVSR
jgi:hypothetical protein